MQPDPAGEFLRISDHYHRMSEEELLLLARHPSRLTDIAQQALAGEISYRGLKSHPEEALAPTATADRRQFDSPVPELKPEPRDPPPQPRTPGLAPGFSDSPDSPYYEDRQLVLLRTVWSLRDALQIQDLLDRASIPFYMGPEKAMGVDRVTSNFANGVNVAVMRIGWPWALQALTDYFPKDEPPEEEGDENSEEVPVRCPRCHSTDVVFHRLVTVPPLADESRLVLDGVNFRGHRATPRFQWKCDSCGHHWQDDGLVKEH